MDIKVGERYEHYKNKKQYTVVAIGYDSLTTKKVVVYQALYDDSTFGNNAIWVRSFDDFIMDVNTEEGTRQRFTKVA